MLYIFLIGVRGFFFVSGDKQKDSERRSAWMLQVQRMVIDRSVLTSPTLKKRKKTSSRAICIYTGLYIRIDFARLE
jgi:hypothetical protein